MVAGNSADCGVGPSSDVASCVTVASRPDLGVVDGVGGGETRLSSLLLLKTAAAASFHVGIGGIFLVSVADMSRVAGAPRGVVHDMSASVGTQNLSAPAPTHLPVYV